MSLQGKMLGLLTGAYNNKPGGKLGKLLKLFADMMERIKTAFESIRLWKDLYESRGITLDRLGLNMGVARGGADDNYYRLMIATKIMAQRSGGDINTVIYAASALLGIHPERVELREVFPAGIFIYAWESDINPERICLASPISRFIKRCVAAGVALLLLLRVDPIRFNHYQGFKLPTLSVYMRIQYWPITPVRLDGSHKLDGSWRLNQSFLGLRFQKFTVSVCSRHEFSVSGMLTTTNIFRLDGLFPLDGSKKLNAGIIKEVL